MGLADATFIGLGSMIGAGVFAAFTPAAQAAGSGLLVGLVVAALVAACNALASAQLAARYPTSGGSYVYGRERLGPWWGFIAGWGFVVGKTASCAAMALAFALAVAPAEWVRPVAVAVVVALGAVNYLGVRKTVTVTKVIVVVVLASLSFGVGAALPAWNGVAIDGWLDHGPYGILQSAGLLFFAFAGYARVATMGEEVREPASTIPRAIAISLAITVLIYGIVAVTLLGILGAEGVASTPTPLADAVAGSWIDTVVRVGAAAAALGALLGLMAGIGRTSLAMAREGDLPRWLAAVHPRFGVPHRAEVVLTIAIVVLVLTIDLGGAIGFSSFGVLVYYAVTNAAAFTLGSSYPRALAIVGAALCALLIVTLPLMSIVGGVIVIVLGVIYRAVRIRVG